MHHYLISLSITFILFSFLSCSPSMIEEKESPNEYEKESTVYETIKIPFDYKYELMDKRPHLTCETYSDKQKDSLNDAFYAYVARAKTTRGKVVSAALFLVTIKHCIPYSFSMVDNRTRQPFPGHEYNTLYNQKGLFLKSIYFKGYMQPAWGCMVKRVPGTRLNVKNLGDSYPNGLNCSSFIVWCLVNGDVGKPSDLYMTSSLDFRNFPKTTAVPLSTGHKVVLPGDLLWFEGHIAIVIGVEGDNVIYASAQGGGDAALPTHGIRWLVFNRNKTDYSKFAYTHLIKMAGVYNE